MSTASPPARLEIRIIPVTPLQQNCSLLWNAETRRAAFIDPGGDIERLTGALRHFELDLTRIWLTHGHLDHAGAAAQLRELTGAVIEGPHREDQFWLDQIESSALRYGLAGLRNVSPDRYLEDGDQLDLDGLSFEVLHTPGHTPGHVVIVNRQAQIAFVGDVLFVGSIGRTDFPRGNHEQLIASITNKLWPLGETTQFVPGHGPTGTFGAERRTNPFVADVLTGFGGARIEDASAIDQKLAKRWQ